MFEWFDEDEEVYGDVDTDFTDRFSAWREADDQGFVLLAFAVLTQAIVDLFYGTFEEKLDASMFLLNESLDCEEESTIDLWLSVLGMDRIPLIIEDYLLRGKKPTEQELNDYISNINTAYANIKIDFLYVNTGGRGKKD